MDETPVIEYDWGNAIFSSNHAKIYEDGRATIGYDQDQEIQIPQSEIEKIVTGLAEAGFFAMEDSYSAFVLDGWDDRLTLNCEDRTKTVRRRNHEASDSYDSVTCSLKKLIEDHTPEPEPKYDKEKVMKYLFGDKYTGE